MTAPGAAEGQTFTLGRGEDVIPEEVLRDPTVTAISCSFRDLMEVPEAVGSMTWLRALDVHYTKIKALPDLSGCVALRTLKISSWELPEVPPQLRGLPLTHLGIAVETLTEEGVEILAGLEGLETLELELRKCEVDRIDTRIFALPKLRALTLVTWNATLRSAEGLERAAGLRRLTLTLHGTERLPDLDGLKELEELELKAPDLERLPALPTSLVRLKLEANKITALPDSLGRSAGLRKVSLFTTPIRAIPPELGECSELESFEVQVHQVASIPPEVGKLKRLRVFKLAGLYRGEPSPLTEVPDELAELPELEHLELSGGRLCALPEAWGRMPKIRVLSLSNNPIEALPASWSAMPLRVLYLRECALKEAPACLFGMAELEHLSLTGNTFPPKAHAALEALGLPHYRLELPRKGPPRKGKARRKRAPSPKPLSPAVMAQLARLGAEVRPSDPPEAPRTLTIGGEEHGLPEALRQWIEDVRMPKGLSRSWAGMRYEVTWCRWDDLLSEYEVVKNGPWIALAHDPHYSIWVVSLHDRSPADPTVFKVDHDDFSATEPGLKKGKLSAWLRSMSA